MNFYWLLIDGNYMLNVVNTKNITKLFCIFFINIFFAFLLYSCGSNYENIENNYQDASEGLDLEQDNVDNNDLNIIIGPSERSGKQAGMYFDKTNLYYQDGISFYMLFVCNNAEGEDVTKWSDCLPLAQVPSELYNEPTFLTPPPGVDPTAYLYTNMTPIYGFFLKMVSMLMFYDKDFVMKVIQARPEFHYDPGLGIRLKTMRAISWSSFSLLIARQLSNLFFGWWLFPPATSPHFALPGNMLGRFAHWASKVTINNFLHNEKISAFLISALLVSAPLFVMAVEEHEYRSSNIDYIYSFRDEERHLSYSRIMSHAIGPDYDKVLYLKNMDYTAIIFSLTFSHSGYQYIFPRATLKE